MGLKSALAFRDAVNKDDTWNDHVGVLGGL